MLVLRKWRRYLYPRFVSSRLYTHIFISEPFIIKKKKCIIILLPESHRLFNTVSFFSSEAATEYSYIYIHDKRFYEFVNYQLNCFMRLHYGNYFTFTISFFYKSDVRGLNYQVGFGRPCQNIYFFHFNHESLTTIFCAFLKKYFLGLKYSCWVVGAFAETM